MVHAENRLMIKQAQMLAPFEGEPNAPRFPYIKRALCPVEVAARIIGQKWTLQIVNTLINGEPRRFCELQEALGGVNPSTLTSRLKYLEEIGMVQRDEVSAIPPHVEYSLSEMGRQLDDVIREISRWSRTWLCPYEDSDENLDEADDGNE